MCVCLHACVRARMRACVCVIPLSGPFNQLQRISKDKKVVMHIADLITRLQ